MMESGLVIGALIMLCLFLLYRLKTQDEMWRRRLEETQRRLAEEYSEGMMNRETRIFALQSQINPHFLYNTLECIRSEALLYECDSIARMAKALALFFRYSISKKENLVTVRDELANIENYFLIQSYRFDNKFSFEIQVDKQDRGIYDCLIPKLSLQPLVENAIFHGLETQPGTGRIVLRMVSAGEKVLITVSDNGVGMEREKLEEIQQRLRAVAGDRQEKGGGDQSAGGRSAGGRSVCGQSTGGGSGIALSNVCQRIRLVFGNEYGLNVYSVKGLGTDIELVIPRKTKEGTYET